MRIMKGLAKQTAEAISPSAVRGKDGFLFLGGEDHNSILSYLSAEKEIKYDAIRIHEANLKALDDLNLPYSMLVVPEALRRILFSWSNPNGSSTFRTWCFRDHPC